MGILILEDGRSYTGMNRNAKLKQRLLARGHEKVSVFDGRRNDPRRSRILDPLDAADVAYTMLLDIEGYGAVLDLQWFRQEDYGERMWRKMRSLTLPTPFKLVVYSQLVGADNRTAIARRIGIPPALVFPRNKTPIDDVAAEFDPMLPTARSVIPGRRGTKRSSSGQP